MAKIDSFETENQWIYNFSIIFLILLSITLAVLLIRTRNNKNDFRKTNLSSIKSGADLLSKSEQYKADSINSEVDLDIIMTMINAIPDRIYIKDQKSRFLFGNAQMAKILKLEKAEDMNGKTDFDFHSKERANDFYRDEQDLIKGKVKIIKKEEKSINESGEEVTIYTTKVPMFDNNGKVIGIMGIGRDISDLKVIEKENLKANEALQEINGLLEERQEELNIQSEELKIQSNKVVEERNQILALINSMPDRIYIKDRKSRFILGNIHVAKIMGTDNPDDLIGKTDYDFYPKDLAEPYFNDEQELMKKDIQIINKEEKGYNEAKEEIVVSTTKVTVKDPEGNVIGIVGIGRDITNQKEIEKQLKQTSEDLKETNVLLEERQEEIFQQAEELKTQTESLLEANLELEKLSLVASKTDSSIIIMDGDGNFEWVNEGFQKRYGMDLNEFIKSRGKNLRQNSSSKEIVEIFEKIKESKVPGSYITQTTDVNNKIFWSQTSITPLLDHNDVITSMIVIDIDISKVKEAEEHIAIQNEELKTLNATKDKFFSIIAHDLKNPFHSIMGFSELLFRNFNSIENEKKVEFIKLINESSTSAYGLLENLLNWARTQTNKISFEPTMIDLRSMFSDVYQMLSVNAKNKGIDLVMPQGQEEIKVFADFNMISTILRNLSSNALKFSEAGGEIRISTILEKDRVKITVSDTGLGMTPEVMNRLFKIDEFHTQKGTAGETGTGLGLIICQEFALRHNSKIEVTSEPGKGSSFSFSLETKTPNTN